MISNFITENNDNSKLISESNIFNNKSNEKEEKKNLNKSSKKVIINKSKYFKFNENKKIIPSLSCDNFIKKSKNRNNNQLIKENEKKDKKIIYNILVVVRVRPLNKKEKKISQNETVSIINENLLKFKDPNFFLNPNNIRSKEKIREFDSIFSGL